MIAANLSISPSCLSAPAKSKTPPSELIRPPSNAAVTFFLQMLGKENGTSLSLSVAGMRQTPVLASESGVDKPISMRLQRFRTPCPSANPCYAVNKMG